MKSILTVLVLTFLSNGADPSLESDSGIVAGYDLSPAFPGLKFEMPVELITPRDNSNLVFVVEQKGKIMSFLNQADVKNASVFLDIERNVDSGGEKGLLGLAFHPAYKNNGYFYVNYTRSSPLETVISRFKVSRGGSADPATE